MSKLKQIRYTDETWSTIDNGATLATRGSENGILVLDEEHPSGARIAIEKESDTAPYAITCGVYGFFFHTVFCRNEEEAYRKYEDMKTDLELIMNESDEDARYELGRQFVDKY